jgi:mRNA interferase HigB
MRIISRRSLREFWSLPARADAMLPLKQWYAVTKAAQWKSPADVKLSFGANVDYVKVRSGNTLAVFDIGGNKYRLVAAVHYDFGRVFILRVLTHREYDLNHWKLEL